MSFALFLLYLFIVIVRPIEALELDVGNARPMLALWLVAFAFGLVRAFTKEEVAARTAHYWLFGLLLIAIMASQIRQGYLGGALAGFLEFGTSAGLFFLVAINVTTMQRLKAACFVLLFSIGVVSGLSVYSYHTGYMADQLVLMQGIDFEGAESAFRPGEITAPAKDTSGLVLWRIRGLGFMNDPNDLAQGVVMVLPLLWGLRRVGKRLSNLLFVWLPGALFGYTIYLTHSRGALLGVASLFFFGLHKWLGTAKTVMAGVLAALVPTLLSFGGGRAFSSGEKSAGERIEAWYEGLQMFKRNPIFGVGYGNFLDHHNLTAHNSFVLCFAELGLVGFFAWIGIIVVTYKGLQAVIDGSPISSDAHRLAVLLRASLIGFLTCAWFLSRTYQATLFIALGFASAVWYLWAKHQAPEAFAGARPRPRRRRRRVSTAHGAAQSTPMPGMAKVSPPPRQTVFDETAEVPGSIEIREGRRRYVPVALRDAVQSMIERPIVIHPEWLRSTFITMGLCMLAVYLFVLLDNLLVK